MGERRYWGMVGLAPHPIAEKLFKAFNSGNDINAMLAVLEEFNPNGSHRPKT